MKLQQQNKKAYQAASYFDTIRLRDENGQPTLLPSGAKIIFGVKKYYTNNYVIKKILDENDEVDGSYPLSLTPDEMDITPTRYYYDVSIQTSDGELIRIVPKSDFDILESITRKETL